MPGGVAAGQGDREHLVRAVVERVDDAPGERQRHVVDNDQLAVHRG
jgi:hypothetical protein